MNKLIKYPTHYSLEDYTLGENAVLEHALSKFERFPNGGYTYEPVGYVYDKEAKRLMIPGGMNPYYVMKLTGFKIDTPNTYDEYDEISIRCTGSPRDNLQIDMLQFLIGEGKFVENKWNNQLACNAATGVGKTFGAIATQTYMRCRMLVIVNRTNIAANWIKECLSFTDVDSERTLMIDTLACKQIMQGKIDPSEYYTFFVLQQTIRAFAHMEGNTWNDVTELFKKLRIGLKVYDEANMEFRNTLLIDSYTNTYKTLYLTATMKRSDMNENVIFQKAFKVVPRFDQYALGYNDSKKHIIMLLIRYNSYPSVLWRSKCKRGGHGFNSKVHSDYQINDDPEFYDIIFDVLDRYTIKKNFRTLILVSKINSCVSVAEQLREMFPNKKIGIYNSSIGKIEKARVLEEDDIIVSITKSLGFSETISNLRLVINCEAFRFDGTGDQASGRLRKLPGDPNCLYIELCDEGFPSIPKQVKDRLGLYTKIFQRVIEIRR